MRPMAETKTVKLDPRVRGDQKKLEALLADGWTVATEQKKSALEWGRKTVYSLVRG